MRVTATIIFLFLLTACSTTRKSAETSGSYLITEAIDLSYIETLNLTNSDFNINKAELEIKKGKEKESLLAIIKYRKPSTYLISLRSKAGIEAARVLFKDDTLIINDRINRKLYLGSEKYLVSNYGIKPEYLPVVLGDYIRKNQIKNEIYCSRGIAEVSEENIEYKVLYAIDCRYHKVKSFDYKNIISGAEINGEFMKYDKNQKLFAQQINLSDRNSETEILIKIIKVEFSPNDSINFIPGKDYERIVLK